MIAALLATVLITALPPADASPGDAVNAPATHTPSTSRSEAIRTTIEHRRQYKARAHIAGERSRMMLNQTLQAMAIAEARAEAAQMKAMQNALRNQSRYRGRTAHYRVEREIIRVPVKK